MFFYCCFSHTMSRHDHRPLLGQSCKESELNLCQSFQLPPKFTCLCSLSGAIRKLFFVCVLSIVYGCYRQEGRSLGIYPTLPEGETVYLISCFHTKEFWIIFLSHSFFPLFILFFGASLTRY